MKYLKDTPFTRSVFHAPPHPSSAAGRGPGHFTTAKKDGGHILTANKSRNQQHKLTPC